jgi:branched-chain amino acid transport system substrate-binding protein
MLKMKKKAIVMVFTALLALSAVIFFPTITSIPVKIIKIGVVSSSWAALQSNVDLYNEIIGPELNEYLAQLPTKGFSPKLRVELLIDGPDEDEVWLTPERHLEKVQAMAEDGVEFFIAGFWSSQYQGTIDYINENGLIMVSPSSTAPALAWDDNGFRLAPPDTYQAEVINQMLQTYRDGAGIEAIVVLLRDDVWANGIVSALGGIYYGEIYEIRYDPETEDFAEYLMEAEIAAEDLILTYGYDHVGVLLLAFDEAVDILQEVAWGYPTIYDLSWFGSEGMGRSQAIFNDAALEACHVHLVSALGAPPNSWKFNDFADRWAELGYEASFYTTTAADAAWLIVETYLDMRASTLAPITGGDMALIFRDNAANYYGYSGWTQLDEYGDRMAIDYDIWGFREDPGTGEPLIIHYGYYDSMREVLHWTYEPRPWE